MSIFDRNLAALQRRDPVLAARIAACERDPGVVIETSRTGLPVLRMSGRLESSSEDPEREAREIAAAFASAAERMGATRRVIFGASAHTLRCLSPVADASVLVIEPSLAVCRALLESVDLADILEHISLLVSDRVDAVLRHPLFRGEERGVFLAQPSARRRARELHDALAERFVPGGSSQPLDIAVVQPLDGGSLPVALAVARALRQLGHRVREIDWNGFGPAYAEIDRHTADMRLAQRRSVLRSGMSRVLGELLIARFQVDPPDMVFALAQAPLDMETLAALGRMGIARAFWFCEDAHVLPYWKHFCTAYDVFFHLQPDVLSEPLHAAGAYGAPLQLGFDPELHRPLVLSDAERARYACDLSSIGAGYHNRRQFLPGLADLGLRLYGTSWPAVSPFLEMSPEFNVWQSSETSNLIFNASRINLNLHSSPWVEGVNPVGDYVNPRTFELAGARAFQLVDERSDLPRFFEPGREIATFRDLDECRSKIAYYLAHEDERVEMAAAAQRRALAEHTYRHRMAEAIDRICAGPLPLAPRQKLAPTAGAIAASQRCAPELRSVLGRIAPERVLDAGAISEAVSKGEGPLDEAEQILLFMRESLSEVVVREGAAK
jgi:spore maturation protein CgeB